MTGEARQILLGVVGGLVLLSAATVSIIAIHHFTNSDILVALLGPAGAIIVGSTQYRWAKEKEAEVRLFSEKQAVYTELIFTIMGMVHNPEGGDVDQAQIVKKLQDIRSKLIVWGSARTLLAADQVSTLGEGDSEAILDRGLLVLSALFSAIRADLGHKDPPGVGLEMALGILVPNDRQRARERLAKNKLP